MLDDDNCEEVDDNPLPWEPAGHSVIVTGNVASCVAFWRTFIRNLVAMTSIEEGYMLLWTMVVR